MLQLASPRHVTLEVLGEHRVGNGVGHQVALVQHRAVEPEVAEDADARARELLGIPRKGF